MSKTFQLRNIEQSAFDSPDVGFKSPLGFLSPTSLNDQDGENFGKMTTFLGVHPMNKQPMMSIATDQKKITRPHTSNLMNKLNRNQAIVDNEHFMQGSVRAKKLVDLPKADTLKHADARQIL